MTDPVLKPWEKRAKTGAKPWEKYGLANGQGGNAFVSGADQFSSGLNEGLAGFAGMPVDLMTGALNLGSTGINALTGSEIPMITDPVGGSGTFTGLMDPLITDRAPEGAVERYLRRGGQEIGFGIPAALTGASFTKFGAPAREAAALTGNAGADALKFAASPYMAASVAGDVGAGLAGQTAQEIAPGNATADLVASMLGGAGGAGLASAFTPRLEAVPTLDDLKAREDRLWGVVDADQSRLTDTATGDLAARVKGALPDSQLAEAAYPNAFKMADTVGAMKNPRISEVVEGRRIIGDSVAGLPAESRVGVGMKGEIADYLAGLKPTDLQGGADPEATLDAFFAANRTTAQIKKAESVLNKEMRGQTRAATTGTGGNEVNATRQNIRGLYDIERDPTLKSRRQGFSPDEMAAMGRVVEGTGGSNIARLLGRLAPTSGAFPMMTTGIGGASGLTAAAMGGSPMMAVPAIAGGIGMVAKSAAEGMTKRQISDLIATILNGGRMPAKSTSRSASQRAIVEQLLQSGAQ